MTQSLAEAHATAARHGPIASVLGKALISLIEPLPGREREYNRWYEDDHAIISALACPWVFGGKRWVATRRLRDMRTPACSAVTDPVDQGCYLATYWILDGRYEDFLAFARPLVVERLTPDGRMKPARKHIFTNDHDYLGAVYRDAAGPRDIHALAYPYAGLGLQVIDAAPATGRDALARWLVEEHLPATLAGASAAMALLFATTAPPRPKPEIDWYDRRLTLLWFLEEPPEMGWHALFGDQDACIAASGLGRVELAAPFMPVLPGTDSYVDELR
jgi:hypothetical protein